MFFGVVVRGRRDDRRGFGSRLIMNTPKTGIVRVALIVKGSPRSFSKTLVLTRLAIEFFMGRIAW